MLLVQPAQSSLPAVDVTVYPSAPHPIPQPRQAQPRHYTSLAPECLVPRGTVPT